ncbi:aldo-keto reductase family protein [Kibdelosporangium aridum]|uniref:Aldo/keto reductase family protein n=1 Tax=Kibdelosporangium aridum TaxID=2030 RepID=A0A1W2FYW0_KIBAR|nr:hypothetical protein [Kibdelosporangium aridum]SMD27043.1 hypothetical protein SAMN05661093_10640 [Kibdelosporangium aridum]
MSQVHKASELINVAAVQNKYYVSDRVFEDVLRHCEITKIAFVPCAPLATGTHAVPGGLLDSLATKYRATPAQPALAWLLRRSCAARK